MRPDRIGLGVTLALHAIAAAALLSYAPARQALLQAAPIMIDLIAPARVEPPKPQPAAQPPKSRPAAKPIERTPELPVVTAPADAPSPSLAPPPQAMVAAPPALPAPLTPPVFNADYLDNPPPAYPGMSRRLGEQGRVILRVLVNARDTVRGWRFVPARRGAEPAPAWVVIPISFRLEG